MNYGLQNERDFVTLFHEKYFYELDENSKCFLKDLFENAIDNDERIVAWKNNGFQKADIFIKYKKNLRAISLKCGSNNSIHCEQAQEFKRFLKELNIPYRVIDCYMSYHFGYKKDETGHNDYSSTLSAEEYKSLYQEDIDLLNETINKTKILIEMVDRFLIRGRNANYDIDALISGTTNDYVWILKYDIYDLILSKKDVYYSSPHIGCLIMGPKKRNLDNKIDNIKDRYKVSVRWNYLREDIETFRNKHR